MTTWLATAPSNIALIKYMGKTETHLNLPSNPSISYTLDHLQTWVELELTDAEQDLWQPLVHPELYPLQLSDQAQQRFLRHLQRLKQHFGYSDRHFIVRSANTFPADCGLASSASSFAALTRCACQALAELTHQPIPSPTEQANLSRQGSGSSCRSFFSPWAYWHTTGVEPIELPYPQLIHQVIVIANQAKSVSSSQAHQAVTTSMLFQQRPQRANQRLQKFILSLQQKDWQQAYEIAWQEFWDMHALFETADPPFGYLVSDTLLVLNNLRQLWQTLGDGPLITLDAGPNIHLLFRPEQQRLAQLIAQQWQQFPVLTSVSFNTDSSINS